jgi:hypothetical protein
MGIEPTNGGTTNHCLNHLATLAISFVTIASDLSTSLGVKQKYFEIFLSVPEPDRSIVPQIPATLRV